MVNETRIIRLLLPKDKQFSKSKILETQVKYKATKREEGSKI